MTWCATALNCFTDDDPPEIKPECRIAVDELREHLMWLDPVTPPHLTPPPDWTGWRAQYHDRLGANFVRDWRPQTKAAIAETFRKHPNFPHVRGVNALQRVPFVIDQEMVKLAEARAVDLLENENEQRRADELLVKADIDDARWLGNRGFYLGYNCDKRGRV